MEEKISASSMEPRMLHRVGYIFFQSESNGSKLPELRITILVSRLLCHPHIILHSGISRSITSFTVYYLQAGKFGRD
jgi:hypothetical protein